MGVVQVTPSLIFTDVLYVSKFCVSLLSISQFTEHSNYKIIFFFLSHCVFKACRLGGLVRGMRGDMHYLDDRVTSTSLVAGHSDPVLLWHWCLGHPSVQKLRYVVPIESSVFTLGCESSELGNRCATYQSRVNNCSDSTFELVHSDVWGPSPMLSVKSFRYFLIFDDFSCMS